MNKILDFKKIVSIGFFAAFLAVFLSTGSAQASFWDWFNLNKTNSNSQQATAIANAETTYKWVNNGSVPKSDSRKTGDCSTKKQVTTYTCSSSTKGNKLYDGTSKGSTYGDTGHAWPIYEGENTSTATEYTYNSDNCTETVHKESGTVNEWECKSSDSTANSSSSSSSSNSSNSASSVSKPTVTTGSATNITSNSVTISATINNGGATSVDAYLYYAKSGDSSWTKAVGKTLSGSGDQTLSADITGLSAGTKYYYLAYARNRNNTGDKNGTKESFTTSGSSTGSSSSSSSVQQYTLNVKISGGGRVDGTSGDVTVIRCKKSDKGKYEDTSEGASVCSVKINKGKSVTLTVSTPSTKYEFATWADDCRNSQKLSTCAIEMNGNKTVSATFNKKTGGKSNATVSVRKLGSGVGKVVSIVSAGKNSGKEDGAINCGSDCSENYQTVCEGNENGGQTCGTAYFRAVPEKGSSFGGWGGDCATFKDEKYQCYVNLDGEINITATFNEGSNNPTGKYYDLNITASAGGTVTSTDGKINCGSGNTDCAHSYAKNTTTTLTVTPNSGYKYDTVGNEFCLGNTRKNNGIYTCQVKMTKKQNLTVNFKTSGTTSSSSSSTSSSSTSANQTATTSSVTNLTSTSATLNGTVNPNGENVAYIFSYYKKGTSEASWKNTSWKSVSGSGEVSASADITGLSSGASYYYILQAYSYTTKKTVNGGGKSFTTSGGSSSSSSSSSSSQTTSSTYRLKVIVQGNGRVQDSQSKIDCGSNMTCQANYSKGQVFTLKTEDTDSEGKSFGTKIESWSGGGCSGGGATNACAITMDGDKEVTIKFVSK